MPFCPKCCYEYEPGINKCPDCSVDLVKEMPQEKEEKQHDWVQLARISSHAYAAMIEEVFISKEIPIVVQSGTGHFGVTGQMGVSSARPIGGSYSIMVPKEYLEQADSEGAIILGDEWEQSKLVDFN